MQAWKIYYGATKELDKRWVTGIVAQSRDDAFHCLKSYVKFEFSVEKMEYLGEIHALSPKCEFLVAQKVNKQNANTSGAQVNVPLEVPKEPATIPLTPAEIKLEDTQTDEMNESSGSEVECQYCGKVTSMLLLEAHENKCPNNPNLDTKEDTVEKDDVKESPAKEAKKEFKCEFCEKSFKDNKGLSYHQNRCESNPNKKAKK